VSIIFVRSRALFSNSRVCLNLQKYINIFIYTLYLDNEFFARIIQRNLYEEVIQGEEEYKILP